MSIEKFISPEKNPLFNPVDWFNFFGSFVSIFEGEKNVHIKSETEVCMMNPHDLNDDYINNPTFVLKNGKVQVCKESKYGLAVGSTISKFMLLSLVKYNGDYFAAMSYVSFFVMKNEIPYIRVGTDYYKVIKKEDRWGAVNTMLKPWKKDEIKEDHTKSLLKMVFKFDDFTIIPNNKEFLPVKNGCYNLYSKFAHTAHDGEVTLDDIPTTNALMKHIFGHQFDLGMKYMKLLYENPKQILPVLALVSTERETGKTTFLNWISMIYGNNSILISPDDLTSNFNSLYATKNIIMVDETIIEKSTSVEKLKSLATAKSISVSQKFVQQYSIPFFGKIIICTNKEKDFMRIDQEEIRFWVRKIKPISGKKNTRIEEELFDEIPKFLRYLEQLPEVDLSKSRMVFTQEEITTDELHEIKKESKSGLCKELEILIQDFFHNTGTKQFEATAKDIKERWFGHNNQISIAYIRKVLKDEMKVPVLKVKRYKPFAEVSLTDKVGQPFEFELLDEKPEKPDEIVQEIDFQQDDGCPF